MIGNRFYTWFKNYYQWVGGAFNETLLLPLVRATQGLRAGAIRYDETTDTVETYDGENWNPIPSATGFVPYTGASQEVNLGEQGLEAGYVQLDTTPTGTPEDQGTMYWDADAETIALIMNGTVQKVGEDVFFHVQNKTGQPIPKGSCVRFDGTDGNSGKILIAPFIANGTYPSQYFMGVTAETIAHEAFGKVYHFGKMRGVNTQAFNAGDILYASTTVAGGFQTTAPVAPNNIIIVAAVISKANNGVIMIRSTLGSNINTDEGVLISGAANNQGLFYDNGLWRNKSIATVLGYTPGTVSSVGVNTSTNGVTVSGSPITVSGTIGVDIATASGSQNGLLSSTDWSTFNNKVPSTRTLTINGTEFDLSANRSWSVGTVKLVQLSTSTSGVLLDGGAVTGMGNLTFNIATATAASNGLLSSTDWSTFNAKQAALTLTTTGNSGASSLVGQVLNIPEYTASGLGAVPTSRTLTINGTALDLSANRSWSVGTVTSVGLTSATSGVTITDSPVTVSGTIGIAIATANGSQQGLLSSTDWTTFNNKQTTLSLTTSGTSGAATLVGATLNVPEYQAQGNYITSLTGEATASGPGAASVTLGTTAVTGKLLTGLNLAGGGTIASTDSILQAFGKVQNQISAMMGGVMFQGVWNANTNTPTLTSSTGTKGHYYIVDVSGTTNLNGITDWRVGDWAIFNGSTWDKVDNTDAVSSVNGYTGAVSLVTTDIAEGTNLYYTDARSRTAISLTTTGSSGAATYDNVSGVINVPQYTLSGLGGVPTTRQITINGTAFDLSADRTYSVGTVTSVGLSTTTTGVTIGNTPVTGSGTITVNIATASGSQQGLLSSTDWSMFNAGLGEIITSVSFTSTDIQLTKANLQVIGATVPLASGSQRGFLSSTDWTTFNNKIGGSGTSGQVAYFNGASSITSESNLFWDATNDRLGIGKNNPTVALDVVGAATFSSSVTAGGNIAVGNLSSTSPALITFQNSVNGFQFGFNSTTTQRFVWNNGALTEIMSLTGSGQLGIGTASPGYKLHVQGTFFTSGNTILAGTGENVIIKNYSNYPWFEGQSASAQLFYGRSGQNPWGIGADATYAFRLWDSSFGENYFGITVGGNVLVGTTTDNGARLQVNGAGTFSSSVTATGGTASYSTSALPTATISTTTTGAINAAYTSIRIGARGQSGQDQSIAITNVPTADGNSAIAFTTMHSYSYAERLRITSGGAVEMTGTIKTGGISGGSSVPWKLGNAFSGAPASTSITIEVEINGAVYQIPAATV